MPNISSPLRPEWAKISQQEFRILYKDLSSREDLAHFWRLPLNQINYYAFHSEKTTSYRTFLIPRRNGRNRTIEQPSKTLKYIQRIIHESLINIYGPHPAVHGFVANKSILTNALNHLGHRYLLNIDLADFFSSITAKRIYGRLVDEPYSLHPIVANMISSLSTNTYLRLPQGSPCSPVIANMVAAEMDTDLAKLCGTLGCWYTRYADDISISTLRHDMSPSIARYPNSRGTGQVILGESLTTIVEKHGFKINETKSRLQSYWTRQMCTGVVVNGKKPTPPRSFMRKLRSLLHHWEKNGWQDAVQTLNAKEFRPNIQTRLDLERHVVGKINYLKMIRGKSDRIVLRFEQQIASLPQSH